MENEEMERRVLTTELTLARLGESCKSAHRRMDDLDRLTRNVGSLASEVQVAIAQMKNIRDGMDALDKRLMQLEKQPAEEFRFYKRAVLSSLLTGVAGALLGAVLALVIRY